ncbi:MAG: 3-dehydroquinate synthase [Bacteroidales bacterium]|jgi:3-dehydroquinate synthase
MQITLNTGPGNIAEIYAGAGSLNILNQWVSEKSRGFDSIFVLTDIKIRSACLGILTSSIHALEHAYIIEIQEGENFKSIETAEYIWKFLADKQASRNSLLINLGGGVITDLGGFVASTYKRGIPFVNIPTSLLGMIDASLGGKTSVNLDGIKNLIGTFQNPAAIFISAEFLKTLDNYSMLSGFAEILKTALIADLALWEELKKMKTLDSLNLIDNKGWWEDIIFRTISIKCRIVQHDFTEKNVREILNFGHTLGHAFESLSLQKKKPLIHGHAVVLGMICECYLSVLKCGLDTKQRDEIINMIFSNYKYYHLNNEDVESILKFIVNDKKRRASEIRFSLLKSPGVAISGQSCDESEILGSINFYRSFEREGETS